MGKLLKRQHSIQAQPHSLIGHLLIIKIINCKKCCAHSAKIELFCCNMQTSKARKACDELKQVPKF